MNYYLKDFNKLKCILDDDENKSGLYYLNAPLEIVHTSNIDDIAESIIVITGIYSKSVIRSILSNLIRLKVRDIIIPTNLI